MRREGSACGNKAVVTDFICLSGDKDRCVLRRLTIMDNSDLLHWHFYHFLQFALPLATVNGKQHIFHGHRLGNVLDRFVSPESFMTEVNPGVTP